MSHMIQGTHGSWMSGGKGFGTNDPGDDEMNINLSVIQSNYCPAFKEIMMSPGIITYDIGDPKILTDQPIISFVNGIEKPNIISGTSITVQLDHDSSYIEPFWTLRVYYYTICSETTLTSNIPVEYQEEIEITIDPIINSNNIQIFPFTLTNEPHIWDAVKIYINGEKIDQGIFNGTNVIEGVYALTNLTEKTAHFVWDINQGGYGLESTDNLLFEYEYLQST